MPIINIKTLKLQQDKKNLMADRIYKNTCNITAIPDIEIYFNEYDDYYINGKLYNNENPVITVEIQGPVIEKEKISELAKAINEVILNTIENPNLKVNYFAYHFLGVDNFAMNGELLSKLLKE